MKKICLSIDQMRQLKELGVETKDASMCWVHLINYNNSLNTSIDEHILSFNKPELYLAIGVHSKIDDRGAKEFIKDITPAFTLQDMLEMMPIYIDKGLYSLELSFDEVAYTDKPVYTLQYIDLVRNTSKYSVEKENLIDTVFDMLVWLAKHGYLKGGEK